MEEDTTPRYTTRRMQDEIKKAEERGRQYALEEGAKALTDDQLLTEIRRRSGGMFRSDVGELIQETLKQLQAEVGRLKK